MKFGQHLDETAVPEWRSRYISYRALKKEIKKLQVVRERGKQGLSFTRTRSSDRSPNNTLGSIASSLQTRRQCSGNTSDAPNPHEIQGRSSKDRKVARSGAAGQDGNNQSAEDEPAELDLGEPYTNLDEPRSPKDSDAGKRNSDDDTSVGYTRSPSEGSSESQQEDTTQRPRPIPGLRSPKSAIQNNSPRSVFSLNNPFLRQRAKPSPHVESNNGGSTAKGSVNGQASGKLEHERSLLPKDEIRFFKILDKEATKVSDFYAEKELEACQRFKEIHQQLHQLRMHHPEHDVPRVSAALVPKSGTVPSGPEAGVLRTVAVPITSVIKSGMKAMRLFQEAQTNDQNPVADVEEAPNGHGDTQASNAMDLTQEVPYKVAKRKLKLAVFEYYRGLEMLKNYKVLNREGFYKILKKYDKLARRDMSSLYMSKVMECNFVHSRKIIRLITETEGLFARYFEGGSRKKAMDRLRVADRRPTHHFSSNRTGIYLGISLVLLIQGAVMSSKTQTQTEIPAWPVLLQIYGVFALPLIFALLVGINLVVWSNLRVNYAFIFELDVRTMLDPPQYFELPAFLFFLLTLAFYLSFLNPNPAFISPYYYPLIWFVVMLVVVFNPLRVGRYSARWWTISSFAKVVGSGLFFVDFKSFFLGDEWNSLAYSTYGMGVFVCSYADSWGPNVEKKCNSNAHPVFFALACFPAWFRFLQCWRRYYDTGAKVHVANAFKYMTTILFYVFQGVWRVNELNGNPSVRLKALFIVFACFYSLYTSIWDIFIDWAVGRPRAKTPFLRNHLLYPTWAYYIAIPIDVGIRFGWTAYLRDETTTLKVRSFAYAAAEMARRFMWNFFRVEAEQQLNIGQYRANREVPLPYHIVADRDSDDEDKREDDTKKSGSNGAREQETQAPSAQFSSLQGNTLLKAASKFVGLKARARQQEVPRTESAGTTVNPAAASGGQGQGGVEDEMNRSLSFAESNDRDVDSDVESGHAIGG